MSGGSLNYVYRRLEEARENIIARTGSWPRRALVLAFCEHLESVEKALHDMEWEISGDGADWEKSLEAVLAGRETEIEAAIAEARRARAELDAAIEVAERKR